MLPRSILTLVACGCCATITAASPQVFQNPTNGSNSTVFGARGPEPFRQSVAADFDGDGLSDVVVQRGTDLEMLIGAAYFQVHLGPFASANDLAVLPGGGPGEPATLITVGGQGLVKLAWDWGSSSYWSAVTLEQDSWLDAQHVALCEASGGSPDVFGIQADGRTIVRRSASGVTSTLVVVPQVVRDLQPLQFVGDSAPEIAVMTGNRIYVYSSVSPYGLLRTTPPYPSHAFAPVRQASGLEQLLWFITGLGGVNEFLLSIGPTSGDDRVQANFGGLPGIVACARGDVEGDGDQDLVYSQTSASEVVVFRNSRGPGTIDPYFNKNEPGALRAVDYVGDALTNRAQPAWSDIDNDGDLDVCFAVQTESTMLVERNAAIAARAYTPSIWPAASGVAGILGFDPGLVVTFEMTAPKLPGADHLELIVWHRPDNVTPTDPRYDLKWPVWSDGDVDVEGEEVAHFTFTHVPLPEPGQPAYFFMIRWVSSGGPSVAPRFPARFYILYLNGAWDDFLDASPDLVVGPRMPLGYGGLAGTVCEIVRLPNLPSDDPPRPR